MMFTLRGIDLTHLNGKNLVTSNGRNFVPTTSGRESVAPQTAPSSVTPVPSNHLKHEEPSSRFNKTEVLPVMSQSRQNDVKLGQFSRQQQPTSSQGRAVVPKGRLVSDVPSSSLNVSNAPSVTRRIDVQGPRYGGQHVAPSSGTAAVPRRVNADDVRVTVVAPATHGEDNN
ncbi:hypothetical protein Tco_0466381 [Tanacetum coccineum]